MSKSMKVSIIIPVHNAEDTLTRCVDSILSQSYSDIECILVENGSEDDSRHKCSELAAQHKNILFEAIEDVGVSVARNIGLSLATGDVIGFCDADDFLEKDAICTIVNEFMKHPEIGAVFCGFNIGFLDREKGIRKVCRGLKNQVISTTEAMRLTVIHDSVMGTVWNKYYRADAVKNVRFDKTLSFCEDMHFNVLALSKSDSNYSVEVISTPLYCYVDNSGSVTHNKDLVFNENDELKYISAMKKIKLDCELDSKTDSYVNMKIALFAIGFYRYTEYDRNRRTKLRLELKQNYQYLCRNIFINNWKQNVKSVCKGIVYLYF